MDKLIARSTVHQDFVDTKDFPVVSDSLQISELPLGGIIRIQRRSSDVAFSAAVASALSVELPSAEKLERGPQGLLAWGAPNEYLWFCELSLEDGFVASLATELVDASANVTLVSDSRIGFLVTGCEARSFLAKGCSIDMHAAAFRVGHVLTTRFAGLPAMLLSERETEFRIYFDIGHAHYVLRWIGDAAEEFMTAAR